MARRKKLNIGHQVSNNEGMPSIPTNTNSTNVQKYCKNSFFFRHTNGVIHESLESCSIPYDIKAEEEQVAKGSSYLVF